MFTHICRCLIFETGPSSRWRGEEDITERRGIRATVRWGDDDNYVTDGSSPERQSHM